MNLGADASSPPPPTPAPCLKKNPQKRSQSHQRGRRPHCQHPTSHIPTLWEPEGHLWPGPALGFRVCFSNNLSSSELASIPLLFGTPFHPFSPPSFDCFSLPPSLLPVIRYPSSHPMRHLSLGQSSCLFLSTSLLVFLLTSSRLSTSDCPSPHLFQAPSSPPPSVSSQILTVPSPPSHHSPPSIYVLPRSPLPSIPSSTLTFSFSLPRSFPPLLLSPPPPKQANVCYFICLERAYLFSDVWPPGRLL